MTFYNVSVKKTYKNAAGNEVTKWLNVGSVRQTDDGKMFLELAMFPNQDFYIFKQEPKEEKPEVIEYPESGEHVEQPSNIPF